jgi:hypothetical protein
LLLLFSPFLIFDRHIWFFFTIVEIGYSQLEHCWCLKTTTTGYCMNFASLPWQWWHLNMSIIKNSHRLDF